MTHVKITDLTLTASPKRFLTSLNYNLEHKHLLLLTNRNRASKPEDPCLHSKFKSQPSIHGQKTQIIPVNTVRFREEKAQG